MNKINKSFVIITLLLKKKNTFIDYFSPFKFFFSRLGMVQPHLNLAFPYLYPELPTYIIF